MAAAMKEDYSMNELELKYNLVTELYDLSEQLIATVESPLVRNPEKQLEIVEPLVDEIAEATDILAEEFLMIAENKRGNATKVPNKTRVEGALRKIFQAMDDYQARVKDTAKKAHGSIQNIADAIVTKIERHMEEVIAVFLEFLNLSLASIMHKQQLEAIKVRNKQIDILLHQHSMSMQQQ